MTTLSAEPIGPLSLPSMELEFIAASLPPEQHPIISSFASDDDDCRGWHIFPPHASNTSKLSRRNSSSAFASSTSPSFELTSPSNTAATGSITAAPPLVTIELLSEGGEEIDVRITVAFPFEPLDAELLTAAAESFQSSADSSSSSPSEGEIVVAMTGVPIVDSALDFGGALAHAVIMLAAAVPVMDNEAEEYETKRFEENERRRKEKKRKEEEESNNAKQNKNSTRRRREKETRTFTGTHFTLLRFDHMHRPAQYHKRLQELFQQHALPENKGLGVQEGEWYFARGHLSKDPNSPAYLLGLLCVRVGGAEGKGKGSAAMMSRTGSTESTSSIALLPPPPVRDFTKSVRTETIDTDSQGRPCKEKMMREEVCSYGGGGGGAQQPTATTSTLQEGEEESSSPSSLPSSPLTDIVRQRLNDESFVAFTKCVEPPAAADQGTTTPPSSSSSASTTREAALMPLREIVSGFSVTEEDFAEAKKVLAHSVKAWK